MVTIEQWGGFDVANYGDLLFPLILEQALKKRLGSFHLTLASPHGGNYLADPGRRVRRIVSCQEPEFINQAVNAGAFVLGGGDIIRFDDHELARLYVGESGFAPTRTTSLFLDELGVLARTRPVLWNAVGIPFAFAPEEHARVRQAVAHVRYLSVRDEQSKTKLECAGIDRDIVVVPDTALLLRQLFPDPLLDHIVERLRANQLFPRAGQTLVVQVSGGSAEDAMEFGALLETLCDHVPCLNVVLLPICICHNDRATLRRLQQYVRRPLWFIDQDPSLEEVAALIAHADAFVGTSLHGHLTAFCFGIPHAFLLMPFNAPDKNLAYADMLGRGSCAIRKWSALVPTVTALLAGKLPPDAALLALLQRRTEAHFDTLATLVCAQRPQVQRTESQHIGALEPAITGRLLSRLIHFQNIQARIWNDATRPVIRRSARKPT